jgi:hypothetical protein
MIITQPRAASRDQPVHFPSSLRDIHHNLNSANRLLVPSTSSSTMSSESIEILSATDEFLSPNPSTTSRSDFTSFFERFTPAPDADAAYTHLFLKHQQLASLLLAHPAMARNRAQTFSTPAASKNKVYFMWADSFFYMSSART